MAIYTGLSGTGVQSLSPGTTSVDVIVTTFPPMRTIGRANPPNYYDIGLLRLGSSGYFMPTFPIDATDMYVPISPGIDEIGYSVFSGGIIEIDETIGGPSASMRPEPWDRNMTPVGSSYNSGNISPPGPTNVNTYTVPAARNLRFVGALVRIARNSVATTAGKNDIALVWNTTNNIIVLQTAGNIVGELGSQTLTAGPMDFPPGTTINTYLDSGDTGGTLVYFSTWMGYTYDA